MPTQLQQTAASLFSTAVFRPLLAGASPDRATRAAHRLREGLTVPNDATNATVVRSAYAFLGSAYRTEYYYRNLIATKHFVGKHRASGGAVLLNEFRVGPSVADCVLINGRGTAYEIKTEYDSPEKLKSQLASYYRAFPFVNVVTHISEAAKYERLLRATPVGIYGVGPRATLSVVKEMDACLDHLDVKTMFDTLRKVEAQSLLMSYHGEVPDVPNGIRYSTYLSLAQEIPPTEFHLQMLTALKGRELMHSRDLLLEPELVPLRALLVQLDPNREGRAHLAHWLQLKES